MNQLILVIMLEAYYQQTMTTDRDAFLYDIDLYQFVQTRW